MNEPRVVESVTNECQSLGRAHESSSARAEQLIACLEGEIAKRDAELAACRVAVENCEVFRARIAELEARIVWLECEAQVNAAPVSEAKAQGVVMPERETELFNAAYGAAVESGWESVKCMARQIWDAARLNAAPVQQVSVPGGWKLVPVNATEAILDVLYSNGMDESDSLLQDIWSAMIDAAPAAPAADAGMVAVEWAKDAEEWGPALNETGWLFLSELNEDPQKSALIFNNTKGPLRAAIMKYAEIVAANAKDSSHE